MVDKTDIKERLKSYQMGIWFVMIFLISIGSLIYVSRYMIKGSFEVGANVNYSDRTETFSVPLNKFMQIVCLGPVFGAIYYIMMRIMLSKVDMDIKYKKWSVYIIEVAVVILIAINSMGHLAHLGFEGANAIDATEGEALNSDYKEMFVMTWFMDEWFGHTTAHVTLFFYLVLAVIAELLIDKEDHGEMQKDELFICILGAIGIGYMNGNIAIRSESGIVLLTLQIGFTIIALLYCWRKEINPRSYPILLCMMLATIVVIYFNVEWIILNGIEDKYPFYSSNLS